MPRPKLKNPLKKVSVYLTPDQIESINMFSNTRNFSFSHVCRMLVSHGLINIRAVDKKEMKK